MSTGVQSVGSGSVEATPTTTMETGVAKAASQPVKKLKVVFVLGKRL